MKLIPAIALAALAALPIGCQQQQKASSREKEEVSKALPPLHIGAVHQVFPDQRFALLRIIGPMPKAGTTLITHPADGSNTRIGNLVVSADQPARNRIIAADIRSGTVVQTDRVFQYRDISPMEGEEESRPSLADDSPSSPVQQERDLSASQAEAILPQQDAVVESSSPGAGQEVSVLPDPVSTPPRPATTPSKAPDYLNDIPDDINNWD